jgi:hypothetical protein
MPPGPDPGPTTITGSKWHDLDDDGFWDDDEPAIDGAIIYVDWDGDGHLDLGEPTARSNAAGAYSVTIEREGEVIIKEAIPLGWRQTYPGEPDYAHILNIPPGGGGTITDVNFGNSNNDGFDFGDAPLPYPTLELNDGPRHPIKEGYGLGVLVDGESDGQPSTDALGDDNLNLADEDGVELPDSVARGEAFTVRVTNTGTGFLQGWIDYNRDGDFDDLGEQIFTNVALDGTPRTFSRTVPGTATPGTTYARFRYGKQGGLGPTGESTREGEVEDYKIDIQSPQPIANNDDYTVEQNSTDNVFLVLANDIPGSSGRTNLRLEADLGTEGASGTAVVDRNGTPNDYTDDFIRYTPAPGAFAPDAFTYTITDLRSGLTDDATVSVTIIPFSGNFPFAVDDTYTFMAEPSSSYDELDVLQNDQRGPTGSITIPANGLDTTGTFGTVELVTVNGQQRVRYSPDGFTGTDQFRYTVVDNDNVTSTATVTIQVPPHTQDDIVRFRVETRDMNGNLISEIGQGLEFQVWVYVDDLREAPFIDPDYPVSSPDDQGVFSAYMDLLYDAGPVAYAGDAKVVFGDEYGEGQFVNSSVPGILDEIGALRDQLAPVGPDEQLLYMASFTATGAAGTTVDFQTDPADVLPLHETAVSFPEQAVDYPRIEFGDESITIVEAPKLVEIELVATDLNGNPLENNQIQAGSDYLVSAYVEDVRDDVADQFKGAFSAYLDVFYPQTLTRPIASAASPFGYDIAFADPFTEGQKAEFIVNSGIINEVGAFRQTAPSQPNQPNPQLLFTARFTALTPPGGLGTIVFTADPADLQPINEVSLIRSGTGQIPDPGLYVPPAQVTYINTPSITVIGGAGEGEFTNPDNPMDVDGDGYTSPHDALALINFLNANGPINLNGGTDAAGEGENGSHYYYDTNADGTVSPLDVIGVINHLNTDSQTAGGEGEAVANLGEPVIVAATVDPLAALQMVLAADTVDASAGQAAAVDVLATATGDEDASEAVDYPATDDEFAEELDSLLADELVRDVAEAWQDPGVSLELSELLG